MEFFRRQGSLKYVEGIRKKKRMKVGNCPVFCVEICDKVRAWVAWKVRDWLSNNTDWRSPNINGNINQWRSDESVVPPSWFSLGAFFFSATYASGTTPLSPPNRVTSPWRGLEKFDREKKIGSRDDHHIFSSSLPSFREGKSIFTQVGCCPIDWQCESECVFCV